MAEINTVNLRVLGCIGENHYRLTVSGYTATNKKDLSEGIIDIGTLNVPFCTCSFALRNESLGFSGDNIILAILHDSQGERVATLTHDMATEFFVAIGGQNGFVPVISYQAPELNPANSQDNSLVENAK
ncbi:hypothetical protein ACPV5G_20950 [Photobacterium damselae]|uniref:hypothetical protein n=1 Tax=Photobacterium damselae TaxID=38293 RepID=UPI004068E144